ncbi:MAG: DNA-3-methyladenine glycosylase [Elusimicrobiota bacterium]|jgi:DNA-3-methyladenine glycosylase|nr:DNA-3-methyladenine glycosylase [Elusimicrobiota bacterium]
MKSFRKLISKDYRIDAVSLAQNLIGKILCRKLEGGVLRLRITESEAYCGQQDTACHASRGKTQSTQAMYLAGGHAYIYLCYGIHWMFNVVAGKKDFPEAVLIRGVEGYGGPGKLTKALSINKTLNAQNLIDSKDLWIEDDGNKPKYEASKRIGIGYADRKDQDKLWRFCICK